MNKALNRIVVKYLKNKEQDENLKLNRNKYFVRYFFLKKHAQIVDCVLNLEILASFAESSWHTQLGTVNMNMRNNSFNLCKNSDINSRAQRDGGITILANYQTNTSTPAIYRF